MLDQVRLHEQLVRLSGGFLLPVVGYNPATDLRENGAAIAVVNEAITKHGCIGVKIYPPNGYLPFGNKSGKCPVPRNLPPWWDGKKLDDRLKALYELCDRLGVPVMAHANESMGEDDDHDRLAGACGWRELASRQDVALTSLTVNAGHFGGDGSTNKDWTEQFTALMGTGPRLKLFADLGYWSDLESSEAARQRLRSALNRTLPDGTRVLDRVMYGSDWLMMSQVEGYQRFPATVLRLLRDMGLPSQDVANVMGRNALACFKLRAGDLNFNRFAKTFGDSVLRQAAWANL
jgi:predicted TIM-barrel fold metal-dependent hydrolase